MAKRNPITIDSHDLSRDEMVLILHEMMDCIGAIGKSHELSTFMDIDEAVAERIVRAVSDESKAIVDAKNGDPIQSPSIIQR